jgi:caffeoyl-CoA O-methyltransferase
MEFLAKPIQAYAEKFTSPEPEILAELNRETWLKVLYPRMLSGHLQGRILSFFSRMMSPRRILEVGTYTGYSAVCLAEGLSADGKLITIDIDPGLSQYILPVIEKAGMTGKIEFIPGDAMDVIPTLNETFDLVFLDADKEHYCDYYQMVKPLLRSGGVVLADNVLWSGNVLDDQTKDKETLGLKAFAQMVSEDTDVDHVLLPVRDGIMMVMKK